LTKDIKTEITIKPIPEQRRLFFIPSSDGDLEDCPKDVKEEFLNSLEVVRLGDTPPNMKPWKGDGPGVYELFEDYRGDTYRAVYTVRFKEAVYVLHVFNKKSKTGIRTPQPDIQKVHSRLKRAESHYEETFKGKRKH
jgi:phage-related protein